MEDALNSNAWVQPNTFMDIIAPNKQTSIRNRPTKSETLMRRAVKKPDFSAINKNKPASNQQTQSSAIINHRPDHFESATYASQSPLISRYSPTLQYSSDEPDNSQQLGAFQSDLSPASFYERDAQPLELAIEQPAINIFKNNLSLASEYAQEIHQEMSKWHLMKRISGWTVLAAVIIGVVSGGLFINRNLNQIEFYLASSKSGFSATLPKISPSGYDLSSIGTGSGAIEANFKSNIDNRSYTISEKKSSPSSGMLATYVQNIAGLNFQAINTDGKTIYIYNGHDATWVSNNIWYIIQDNNSLSDHQIINIADSM